MKLIIDIPEYDFERIREYYDALPEDGIVEANVYYIVNGTPLDDLRAEIDDLDRHYDNDYFSGNKDAMFKCNDVLQIIDKYREDGD